MLAALLVLAAPGGPALGDPQAVARLFEERCATCHSPGSDEPKAAKKWDAARDLAATAANGELLVPGSPDESDLYLALEFDDMPPSDSGVELLDEAQKELVAAWIRDGAQVPAPEGHADAADEPVADATTGDDESWLSSPLMRWLSHFHPLIVHFPVALLSVAFLAELLARFRPAWKTESAGTFCLVLGALSAVPSAILGLLLAENTSHGGDELDAHRWAGIATALVALLVLWAARRWPERRLWLYLLVAALVGFTGHTGGMLSYGSSWLELPF